MSPSRIYLALGSNLDDRVANLRRAVALLSPEVRVESVSALYETEPAYVLEQPRFLNAVLCGHTALSPEALLQHLKGIERQIGRQPGIRFGPRLVDLDILLYGDRQLNSVDLTIPHPRMAERPFVLVPLAEIAPDLVPPGWIETVAAQAARVHGNGDILSRRDGSWLTFPDSGMPVTHSA